MPKFSCTGDSPSAVKADLLVVPAYSTENGFELGPGAKSLDKKSAGQLFSYLSGLGFKAKAGETVRYPSGDIAVAPAILVVGVGKKGEAGLQALRQAGAVLARSSKKVRRVVTSLHKAGARSAKGEAGVRAVVEGAALGGYEFLRYKKDPEPSRLAEVIFAECEPCKNAISEGLAVSDAVNWARDLVNEPAGAKPPAVIANQIKSKLESAGVSCEIWDRRRLAKERLGGVLGVGAGSANDPCLVRYEYKPRGKSQKKICLVGKGVVFDSGGLSLKPAEGMDTMKTDMSGAAAVAATMGALKSLGVKAHVIAFTPFVENMPSGSASKPGDILKFRNNKTAEVLNTDAEGRLILADALSLASEEKPAAIVDLATLTGACMVALGMKIFGVMGNDDKLARALIDAADQSGERGWHLPLPADYRKQIESPIADIKNIGNRYGGALTAGLFLQEFVDESIPWVHLDIAGPARADADEFEVTQGGTGVGVRTLLAWITEATSAA
ncbi:MAG: leucyl aminopeptidase [Acidobacteria bacterium]|nr:MAG: leucyl aminopeptidase [Acidobacteriota bacterium]